MEGKMTEAIKQRNKKIKKMIKGKGEEDDFNLSDSSDEPGVEALKPMLKSKYKEVPEEEDEEDDKYGEDSPKSENSDNL